MLSTEFEGVFGREKFCFGHTQNCTNPLWYSLFTNEISDLKSLPGRYSFNDCIEEVFRRNIERPRYDHQFGHINPACMTIRGSCQPRIARIEIGMKSYYI